MKSPKRQRHEYPVDAPNRQRIVSAARQHFFAYGFRAVTMDDLAGELRMSKKTLYAHFPSKVALMEAVLLDKVRSVEVDLKQITSDQSSDLLATLRRLLACVQGHLEEIQPPFPRDLRREAPDTFAIVENRRRDMIHQYFGKLVGDGQAAGIIREDVPANLIIEIFLGATQAIMNPEKLTDLGIAAKDGFSAIVTVILEGVMSRKERATP